MATFGSVANNCNKCLKVAYVLKNQLHPKSRDIREITRSDSRNLIGGIELDPYQLVHQSSPNPAHFFPAGSVTNVMCEAE
jgi:hypothetical protein